MNQEKRNRLPNVGRLLNGIMELYHISQKEAAGRLGICHWHFHNIMWGRKRLTEEMAIRLEEVFSANAEALLVEQAREKLRASKEKHLRKANG